MEQKNRKTPLKAMRAKCLDCCAGNAVEVRLCPSTDCALWYYRFGYKPESKQGQKRFSTNTLQAE